MKSHVSFVNRQSREHTPKDLKDLIRRTVFAVLEHENVSAACETTVLFVDDAGIRELNREFRQIDRATDVLSFPSGEYPPARDVSELYVGDVALSLQRARRQAEEYGHSYEREVAFLVAHSVLHCLGYDHETGDAEEAEMFSLQEEILAGMGLKR